MTSGTIEVGAPLGAPDISERIQEYPAAAEVALRVLTCEFLQQLAMRTRLSALSVAVSPRHHGKKLTTILRDRVVRSAHNMQVPSTRGVPRLYDLTLTDYLRPNGGFTKQCAIVANSRRPGSRTPQICHLSSQGLLERPTDSPEVARQLYADKLVDGLTVACAVDGVARQLLHEQVPEVTRGRQAESPEYLPRPPVEWSGAINLQVGAALLGQWAQLGAAVPNVTRWGVAP